VSFDPDKFVSDFGGQPSESKRKAGFNPDDFVAEFGAKEDKPYYNPVEKTLMGAGEWVADSWVGKGLKALDDNVANPMRGAIMDKMGVKDSDGDGYRSFKDLFQHKDGIISDTKISEALPGMFSADPKEYKKNLVFKKGGWLDQSPATAIGNTADMILDPTNIIPLSAAGKVAKGASRVTGLTPKVQALSELAGKGVDKAIDKVSHVPKVVASKLSNVPLESIEQYSKHMPEMNATIGELGSDAGNWAAHADEMKVRWNKAVQGKKRELGNNIRKDLKQYDGFDMRGKVESLYHESEDLLAGVNPNISTETVRYVRGVQKKFEGLLEQKWVSPVEYHDLKLELQDLSRTAYLKDGQFMTSPKKGAEIVSRLGRQARKDLEYLAPEQASANKALSRLHEIEKKMNKNLFKENGVDSGILGAGRNLNGRNVKTLSELGEFAGYDFLDDAKKYAATKDFSSPGYLPNWTTGKSLTAMIPSALAYLYGGQAAGLTVGAMTSPLALKTAMNTGRLSKDVVKGMLGVGSEGGNVASRLSKELASDAGKAKFARLVIQSSRKTLNENNFPRSAEGPTITNEAFAGEENPLIRRQGQGSFGGGDNPLVKKGFENTKEKVSDDEAKERYLEGN